MPRTPWRLVALPAVLLWAAPAPATVVTDWNNAALAEIRASRPAPPVAARALAIAHTCMYDAWTAYDPRAIGAVVGSSLRRPAAEASDAAKSRAISHAALRCLQNLFPAGHSRLEAVMRRLGHDPADLSTDTSTPQGIGNAAARAVIQSRRGDGANQDGDLAPGQGPYADYTGYRPRNPPLPFCLPTSVAGCPPLPLAIPDPLHWQPLVSETGSTQRFAVPHWGRVRPFALSAGSQFDGRPDLAPPPNYLLGADRYAADVAEMLQFSATLDLPRKVVVEYWADGPASELPPGHWGLFAQHVSQRDGHSIDRDVRLFFAMHNAAFDAGIVAWHLKRLHDGVRPITAVRALTQGTQVLAWGGPGQPSGVLVPGERWTPYNPGSNLSPSFPGYISGHSTFSSASATVLRLFTGSDHFGYATVVPPGFGTVEPQVPPVAWPVVYATFSAAANEAGLSRLYAGIHFADDNLVGQRLGDLVGQQAWAKASFLFDGGLGLDGQSSASAKTASLAWRHTVADRSNRMLVVAVANRDGNHGPVSVRYGSTPLVRIGTRNAPGNQNRVELWALAAPAPGTADVVVTLSGARNVLGTASSWVGVDPLLPFGSLATAAGQSRSACVNATASPGALLLAALSANGDAKALASAAGQVALWNLRTGQAGGDIAGLGSAQAAAGAATLCQTLAPDKPWALLALPLQPAIRP